MNESNSKINTIYNEQSGSQSRFVQLIWRIFEK